jgi:hypothetical protein
LRNLVLIVMTWLAIGTASIAAPSLVAVLVKLLGLLYVTALALVAFVYLRSDFGKKWVPAVFRQWFTWRPLDPLRRAAPPIGRLVADAIAIVLALHMPLVIAYGAPRLLIAGFLGQSVR